MKFKLFSLVLWLSKNVVRAEETDMHYCFLQAGDDMYRLEDAEESYKVAVTLDDKLEF